MSLSARDTILAILLLFAPSVGSAGEAKLDFEKIEKGVVKIEHSIYGVPEGGGAGFFVSSSGFLLTNRHVMAPYFDGLPTSRITVVTRQGQRFVGDQIKFYGCSDVPSLDVCLLQVATKPAYIFAFQWSTMKKGQKVFEIGHPLSLEWSLSNGIVSGYQNVEPESFVAASVSEKRIEVLQTTAPSSPGNSGGPVFDEYGNVAGMMTFGYTANSAQNLNFAISGKELGLFFKEKSAGKPLVLSALRKQYHETEAVNAKRIYESAIKPFAPKPIPWETKIFDVAGELYEMTVPKGACGDPPAGNNPGKIAFACKLMKGDGVAVRFAEISDDLLKFEGQLVQQPIEYPFFAEIKKTSRWAALEAQITPEQEKFLSSVPGKAKCAKPGWNSNTVGKWNFCRANIYNYPALGASTSMLQVQKPGTKFSVILIAQSMSESRSVLTNGLAEVMLNSIRKSQQNVRNLASTPQNTPSQDKRKNSK